MEKVGFPVYEYNDILQQIDLVDVLYLYPGLSQI